METMDGDGNVQPSGGMLTAFDMPSGPGVRVDTFGYTKFFVSTSLIGVPVAVLCLVVWRMGARTSAEMPASLREILDNTAIGHLTPPEITKQGVEMVVVCSKEPTKVDTPKKREIREKMYNEKYEAKSKAYLRESRAASMIEYVKQ